MRTIIEIKSSIPSTVVIESGLLLNEDLTRWIGPTDRQIAVISDSIVAPLYAGSLMERLRDLGYSAKLFTIPSGEKYKNRKTVNDLQDAILDWGVDRDSVVIGMGGGVVTDVAGYAAATLLRGIKWICLPTSLLGMVDAGIGGKTGVNTHHGKNLIGAFYPASSVLIDPAILRTLPSKRLKEGVVEMLKHGAIVDTAYFEAMTKNAEKILHLNERTIERMVAKSCKIKASIVQEDEGERKGKRSTLNYGHTIGHALELISNYELSHGDAVAIGMVAEAKIAVALGALPSDAPNILANALNRFGIHAEMPKNIPKSSLIQAMSYDKKNKNQRPRIVVLESVGSCHPCGGAYCTEVNEELFDAVYCD